MEKDNEVSGTGNQYDYGFRIYNPRLGRFLSVDPLFKGYPWYTPFQFAGNSPILHIDLDGLEQFDVMSAWCDEFNGYYTHLSLVDENKPLTLNYKVVHQDGSLTSGSRNSYMTDRQAERGNQLVSPQFDSKASFRETQDLNQITRPQPPANGGATGAVGPDKSNQAIRDQGKKETYVPEKTAISEGVIDLDVKYDKGGIVPNNFQEIKSQLLEIAKQLKDNPDATINLTSYSVGGNDPTQQSINPMFNMQQLADRRAEGVKGLLKAGGADPSRIKTKGVVVPDGEYKTTVEYKTNE